MPKVPILKEGHFGKMKLWLLLYSAITPKSEDKYVVKGSTRQSFIFSKWHSFKIGTLISITYHSRDYRASNAAIVLNDEKFQAKPFGNWISYLNNALKICIWRFSTCNLKTLFSINLLLLQIQKLWLFWCRLIVLLSHKKNSALTP